MERRGMDGLGEFGCARRQILSLSVPALLCLCLGLAAPGRSLASDRLQEAIDDEVRRFLPRIGQLTAQEVLQETEGYEEFHINIPAPHYFQRSSFMILQRDLDPAERKPVLALFYDSSGQSLRDTWEALVFKILVKVYGPNLRYVAANLAVNPVGLCAKLDGDSFDLPAVTGTPSLVLFTALNSAVKHYDTEYLGPEATVDISGSAREKIEKWISPALFPHLKVFTYRGHSVPIGAPYRYRNGHLLTLSSP
jgi:hypothetical protein